MTEYDCLLLEHVLWQQPEHAPKIADWLLSQLAVDDGMKQVGQFRGMGHTMYGYPLSTLCILSAHYISTDHSMAQFNTSVRTIFACKLQLTLP